MAAPLPPPGTGRSLIYAHLGDLHITDAKARNYLDFLALLVQLTIERGDQLDCLYLPGDVTDNGRLTQYQLVVTVLRMASVLVYLIAGDHDLEPGSLANFYTLPAAMGLLFALMVRGVQCIFLDVCGPDFRLGAAQLARLREQLSQVTTGTEVALFMHTYPSELANDGTTTYAATRSTDHIEEGSVGYSRISLDEGTVSWRFKPPNGALPCVLITAPADYRLLRHNEQAVLQQFIIHAMVFGSQPTAAVHCWLGAGPRLAMKLGPHGVWPAGGG